MDDRLIFISDLLKSVSKKIAKKNYVSSDASYSYKKGYLAEEDLFANDYICDAINEEFPNEQIFSEEGDSEFSISKNEDCWIIDPICGTTNFVKGFPFYVHSVCFMHRGAVTHAGIFAPSLNELFLADENVSTLNGSIISVSNVETLEESLISINCNQSDYSTSDYSIDSIVNILKPPISRRLHIIESANLELAYVACGRLDAYVNPHDKIWDIAAGSLLIQSAGGSSIKLKKSKKKLTKDYIGVIGANKYLLDPIKDILLNS